MTKESTKDLEKEVNPTPEEQVDQIEEVKKPENADEAGSGPKPESND